MPGTSLANDVNAQLLANISTKQVQQQWHDERLAQSTHLLRDLKVETQQLTYACSRLMRPPAELAYQLDCNTTTTLEVIKDMPFYCKISVQIYKAPG